MARPLTFGPSRDEEQGQAGARQLFAISERVQDEDRIARQQALIEARDAREQARFDAQMTRDAKVDQRSERQFTLEEGREKRLEKAAGQQEKIANLEYQTKLKTLPLAEARELRLAKSAELDERIRQSEFDKQQEIDNNAKEWKNQMNLEAKDANAALRAIPITDPDFENKIIDWEFQFPRASHDKLGDPRVLKQREMNMELRKGFLAKAAAKTARDEAETALQAKKLVVSGGSIGPKGDYSVAYDEPKTAHELTPYQQSHQLWRTYDDAREERDALEKKVTSFETKNAPAAFANGVFERNGKKYFGSDDLDAMSKSASAKEQNAIWDEAPVATTALIEARDEYLRNKARWKSLQEEVPKLKSSALSGVSQTQATPPAATPAAKAGPSDAEKSAARKWLDAHPGDMSPAAKIARGILGQ